ncbi:lipoyl synthase [bacterium endosymbiont of Pedicinus badii]|uniref:lipoyl synthase n=1 Tax=bacterium endosymbiont of Pedicinus badii TaxID=1719126 RepID=UPI0009BA5445|nr:lipoyl synthase [bacterium endosymbiont of Pedicinus badii]
MKKKFINQKRPDWIKIKLFSNFSNINFLKNEIQKNKLNSVCQEAKCPNLQECFSRKIATFMILGNICTRKCKFCSVSKGKPNTVDEKEPIKLAKLIKKIKLQYVVITSVNRDDLKDGGANHFLKCIQKIRKYNSKVKIEILVPDFRNCAKKAIKIFGKNLPNVFNHNIESIPRIHKIVKPDSNYENSINLLKDFKKQYPKIPTKSGIMVGMGETKEELYSVFLDLFRVGVEILTIGQYLPPEKNSFPVYKYLRDEDFIEIKKQALFIGFKHVYSGTFIRSSYHAQEQFYGLL